MPVEKGPVCPPIDFKLSPKIKFTPERDDPAPPFRLPPGLTPEQMKQTIEDMMCKVWDRLVSYKEPALVTRAKDASGGHGTVVGTEVEVREYVDVYAHNPISEDGNEKLDPWEPLTVFGRSVVDRTTGNAWLVRWYPRRNPTEFPEIKISSRRPQ